MNQVDFTVGIVYKQADVYALRVSGDVVITWSQRAGLVSGHPSWVVNLPWQSYCGFSSDLVHTALPRACELAFNQYLVTNDVEYFI